MGKELNEDEVRPMQHGGGSRGKLHCKGVGKSALT